MFALTKPLEYELKVAGAALTREKLDNGQVLNVNTAITYLTEKIGQMLCPKLQQLPIIKAIYKEGRWVISISCCCSTQKEMIVERVGTEL